MSRKAGEPMRKLLALHNEWLVANGYPLHVPREKKKNKTSQFKAQASDNLHAKLPKTKAQAQASCNKSLAASGKFQKV
jgi:hypothetical protein